jgi:hypothetical protein
MKYISTNYKNDDPLVLNRKKAIHRSGGLKIFQMVSSKYNLTPFYKEHKMTLYWREDVDRALLFFKNGISIQSETPSLSGC